MKLLLLNDSYFGEAFARLGAEVLRVGPGAGNDIRVDPSRSDLPSLLRQTQFKPDAVLQVDSIDQRVFFRGVEWVAAPVAYYAIDTPLNAFWQRGYAHAFDRFYVDQFSIWQRWREQGLDWVRWLPLAADRRLYHLPAEGQERDIDLLFVGTLDAERRPKRSAILKRLQAVTEVHVVDGSGRRSMPAKQVADLYRRARIVLNESLFEGVNLRTVEAMACGACVLTEAGSGLDRLFREGQHLLSYTSDTLESVALGLLADHDRMARIGQAGAERVSRVAEVEVIAGRILRELRQLAPRRERLRPEQRVRALLAVLQASQKWEPLARTSRWALADLAEVEEQLPPLDRARACLLRGEEDRAVMLLAELAEQPPPMATQARRMLASLALQRGDRDAARDLSGAADRTLVTLHMHFAEQLLDEGEGLDGGFNRSGQPVWQWTAFEHAQRAHRLKPAFRPAAQLLDRILSARNAPEFAALVWQRYLEAVPDDGEARRRMEQRARKGYLLPPVEQQSVSEMPLAERGRGR